MDKESFRCRSKISYLSSKVYPHHRSFGVYKKDEEFRPAAIYTEASEKTRLKFSPVQCTRIYFFADYFINLKMRSGPYDADLYIVPL